MMIPRRDVATYRRWWHCGPAVLATGLIATTCWANEFLDRLDEAVVQGSAQKLSQLQAELGDTPGPEATDAEVYLWSYTSWRLTQRLPDAEKKRRKRLLKAVQGQLEKLTERQPGDAEAFALLGSVLGARIDGALSGMRLGRRTSGVLEQAFQLAPDNPRVVLQRAVGFYLTPKAFGGGLDKAEQELRRATTLFDREPEDKLWPNWGRLDALGRLGQVLAAQDRVDEARSAYHSALDQAPDYSWIRDQLLPALDSTER